MKFTLFLLIFLTSCTDSKKAQGQRRLRIISKFTSEKFHCDKNINIKPEGVSYESGLTVEYKNFGNPLDTVERNQQWLHFQLAALDCNPPPQDKEKLIKGWLKRQPYSNVNYYDLRWHDHTTALRLIRLVSTYDTLSSDTQKKVLKEVQTHLDLLESESFYSKLTNHGFDQSFIAYFSSLVFGTKKQQSLFLERTINEVAFMFTEQGVHKENSPAYHFGMQKSVAKVNKYTELLAGVSVVKKNQLDKAQVFTEALRKPDGSLPLLGDTMKKIYFKENIVKPDVKPNIYDFANSGYVIINSPKHYLLFKNSFHSRYHRHDDDLQLLLTYNSEDYLIDGGLYKYDENDKDRKFIRSYKAHNLPYNLSRTAIRNIKNQKHNRTTIDRKGAKTQIFGKSRMFGHVLLTRTIALDSSMSLENIIITDKSSETEKNHTRFIFPEDKKPQVINQRTVVIKGELSKLTIQLSKKPAKISTSDGVYSEKYNELKTSHILDIEWPEGDTNLTTTFNFSTYP